MQNSTTANCIKILSTDKGKIHWETYLMAKLRKRVGNTLTQLGIDPWQKRIILKLIKRNITKDNIIKVYSHPIETILTAIVDDNIKELSKYSSTELITKQPQS